MAIVTVKNGSLSLAINTFENKAPVDKTVVIEGSRLTMESTGLAEGIFYYNVTATDASGSSMTRRVGVCVRK